MTKHIIISISKNCCKKEIEFNNHKNNLINEISTFHTNNNIIPAQSILSNQDQNNGPMSEQLYFNAQGDYAKHDTNSEEYNYNGTLETPKINYNESLYQGTSIGNIKSSDNDSILNSVASDTIIDSKSIDNNSINNSSHNSSYNKTNSLSNHGSDLKSYTDMKSINSNLLNNSIESMSLSTESNIINIPDNKATNNQEKNHDYHVKNFLKDMEADSKEKSYSHIQNCFDCKDTISEKLKEKEKKFQQIKQHQIPPRLKNRQLLKNLQLNQIK